ncbi:MAG: ASCH domain-containing protein, partial [Alphaproteobacteria bacterium]|nr:ASCH domain-containing protein [Alphaproteobacteria bacterium]
RKCRFCDIDDAWAKIEGEGDLSLAYWRTVHIDFFNKYFPDFQETDWLELNEFVVI